MYWFLAKIFLFFVPLPWKLDNPYYHSVRRWHAKSRIGCIRDGALKLISKKHNAMRKWDSAWISIWSLKKLFNLSYKVTRESPDFLHWALTQNSNTKEIFFLFLQNKNRKNWDKQKIRYINVFVKWNILGLTRFNSKFQ